MGICTPDLPRAVSDLLLVIWKFVLIHFTLVDLQSSPFLTDQVWQGAMRRFASKANSLTHRMHVAAANAEARGEDLNTSKLNGLLNPLGTIDESGTITWRSDIDVYLRQLS